MATSSPDQPKAYIDGFIEFYKLRFLVTSDVLIPRPETELLVDEVLSYLNTQNQHLSAVLDLGTGSGAIAVATAKNSNSVKVIASDISAAALKVAQKNAQLHAVESKITFVLSDMLSNFQNVAEPDVIVTNLPYIPSDRIAYLDSSVQDFEPHIALDGGEDGFELYRKLFKQIVEKRWKPKLIIGEIDYTHGELAILEAQKYFPEAEVEVKKDLAYQQRILQIRFR